MRNIYTIYLYNMIKEYIQFCTYAKRKKIDNILNPYYLCILNP